MNTCKFCNSSAQYSVHLKYDDFTTPELYQVCEVHKDENENMSFSGALYAISMFENINPEKVQKLVYSKKGEVVLRKWIMK